MDCQIATGRQENLRGALWMVLAMGGFAVEDALLKRLSEIWPVWQVLVGFGLGGLILFGIAAQIRGRG